jgi:hypothetical protein
MPPKKPTSQAESTVPETPAIEDPAAILAREIRERQFQEERRTFEKGEMMSRRTVEAMEQVSWKCVYIEKEKRLDPAAWASKTAVVSPQYIVVKRLTGNRAIPQQVAKIPLTDQMTLGQLKQAIQEHFFKLQSTSTRAVPAMFSPDKQRIVISGQELKSSTSPDELIKTLGVRCMMTLHVSFAVPPTLIQLQPSLVR